jgi:hypothetical protein
VFEPTEAREQRVTRSGRTTSQPKFFHDDPRAEWASAVISSVTKAERAYYAALCEVGMAMIDRQQEIEIGAIGTALGGGFVNTAELRPMKYDEAMRTADKPNWEKAVKEEWERLKKHGVLRLRKKSDIPPDTTILTSTWAMKKKSNGTFRARINGRGYEQIDGEHYDKDDVAAPTVNIVTVRVVLVLMLLMKGIAHLVDVNGAFLQSEFEKDPVTEETRRVYMEIPQGLEKEVEKTCSPWYEWVIELLKTLYGTKQAAKRFWLFLLNIFRKLGYKYN